MRKSTYNCYTMTHETPVGSDVKTSVPLLKHLIKNDSMHASLSFPTCQCGRGCFFLFLPDIIFGVWISTKPFLVRVSLKSWHTPDCRRNTAWLVVVFSGGYTKINTIKTVAVIHLRYYTTMTNVWKQDCQFLQGPPVYVKGVTIICWQRQRVQILEEPQKLRNTFIYCFFLNCVSVFRLSI